jgi:hypothetical protein
VITKREFEQWVKRHGWQPEREGTWMKPLHRITLLPIFDSYQVVREDCIDITWQMTHRAELSELTINENDKLTGWTEL